MPVAASYRIVITIVGEAERVVIKKESESRQNEMPDPTRRGELIFGGGGVFFIYIYRHEDSISPYPHGAVALVVVNL